MQIQRMTPLKTPAQDTNAGKNDQDQTNAEDDKTTAASLVPAEKTTAAPKKDAALTAAASDLQSAITKGDAYVNSDKFTQMTVEKQKQLRDAIQTGKELMAKYNTMQTAMNSAALEVDQNNKNKVETKANADVAALTTLNVDNDTLPGNTAVTNNNSDITSTKLTQAAQNIILLLGSTGATEQVNNWNDFEKYLKDSSVGTIELTGNIAPSSPAGSDTQIVIQGAEDDTPGFPTTKKYINGNGYSINLNNYTLTGSDRIDTNYLYSYMEGKLIPGYHYIEIADDYHDLIDKVEYYEAHPDEAKAIVEHAHEWVRQFQDTKREKIISLMVLERYFQQTGQ